MHRVVLSGNGEIAVRLGLAANDPSEKQMTTSSKKKRVEIKPGKALAIVLVLGVGAAISPQLRGQAQTAGTLPSPTEIVAKYDQALGGEAALRRHISSTMKGTREVHGPTKVVTLPFIFYASTPYLRLEKTSLPDHKGAVLNGFDGELAWSFDPRSGPTIATGDERESVKRDADFYYPLDELTWFKSIETVGLEEYEGQRCYHLHGINNWGKPNDHFYDQKTGLLVGYEFDSEWRGGPGLTHEIFSDYQKVDGVLVPMKQVIKIKSKSGSDWTVLQVLTYSSVTFNDVDRAIFTPPPPVRDLASKGKPHSTS
jgi:hypothetical protein